MGDPADLSRRANWNGGYYELGLELDGRDDDRLRAVAETLWRVARVVGEGSFDGFLDGEHPRGSVPLPNGATCVTLLYASRSLEDADEDERGNDWVCLALPLGALELIDPRIGSFAFGDDGGPASLVWRTALDEWLARIARDVADVVPFRLAVIGFELSGEISATDIEMSGPPTDRPNALLVPGDPFRYFPATS